MYNEDTIKFLKAFNFEKLAIRTFPDKKLKLKGIERKGSKIRCNICGKFHEEKEMFLGYKNPICKKCSSVKLNLNSLEELNKWEKLLQFKNKYCDQGVHFSVNGAHTDKEVNKVYAHFFEIDDKPMEEQVEIIRKLPLKPSMVVKTRKSYHVYFLIKDGELKKFREIQKRLAYTFHADMQKYNESTCMRLPGFYHNKKEPIMVKLVEYNPDLIYTQSDIVSKLHLLRLPPEPEKSKKVVYKYDNKNVLIDMVYNHLLSENKIFADKPNKILISCVNPYHEDNNPSAVFFKDSLYFFCKACGYSKGLYETAIENCWSDIIYYIDNQRSA